MSNFLAKFSRKEASDVSGRPEIHSNKVPAVTIAFWIIKIAATTLGETGGDTLSMTMHLGNRSW
jgi:uncharacterized membrane-anchored protein